MSSRVSSVSNLENDLLLGKLTLRTVTARFKAHSIRQVHKLRSHALLIRQVILLGA